jgi:hypothetical protein
MTRCFFLGLLTLVFTLATAGRMARAERQVAFFDVPRDASETVTLQVGDRRLPVSLRSPTLEFSGQAAVGNAVPIEIVSIGKEPVGPALKLSFNSYELSGGGTVEVELFLHWSSTDQVLRKHARIRLVGTDQIRVLHEVILDRIDSQGQSTWTHGGKTGPTTLMLSLEGPQSHPVFLPGRYVGIEYPVAATRCEAGQIILAHRPGVRLEPGKWYETLTAVYGVTEPGQEVEAFQRYVAMHRPEPHRLHVNYNSWWTSPVPYTEQDILDLMTTFQTELFESQQVALDTFCIDMGWSDPHSVWAIDAQQFPHGFARIREAAAKMQAHLGLWISPSSFYPGAVDNHWASEQGYETYTINRHGGRDESIELLCLGGHRYGQRFREVLTDLVRRWDIHHLKLDGCHLRCPATDHGHEPGESSSEAIAASLIGAVEAARAVEPDIWIETTCFGYNPSPWWLFHVNSVIGTFGDDAPVGRVPAPVHRESYTTARDFFNLQGASLLPIPSGATEVLGIIHQSPDPFLNDAMMTVMRGQMFLPLYVNPRFMDRTRWQALARLLTWTRANADQLELARPLLPAAWRNGDIPSFTDQGIMPPEPYGYAHQTDRGGLIALRNPWMARRSYWLEPRQQAGIAGDVQRVDIVSVYPELRMYGSQVKVDDPFEVSLAPYETVVLRIHPELLSGEVPRGPLPVGGQLQIERSASRLRRVAFSGSEDALGPNWSSPLGDADAAVQVSLDVVLLLAQAQAELLLLCEGSRPLVQPIGALTVNGREVALSGVSSAAGWSATLLPRHEHWVFLRVPLETGRNRIVGELYAASDCTKISAWAWAAKPGADPTRAGCLPQPETISLDSVAVIPSTEVAKLASTANPIPRPTRRINGVFLDALEPASVSQGWGQLQKNRSVWEKPLVISGKQYLRGLGTHAPSRIVFALDGQYRRFQSWVGADGNTSPTVTFEVWIDGAKKWESGLMRRETPAKWVDLDVTDAQQLELIVGDAGEIPADHADWADARLLR